MLPNAPAETTPRALAWLAYAALTGLYLYGLAAGQYADPDMWHEMALFREALRVGSIPIVDPFAYTPTRTPSIHHEWGTGAVLYGASRFGASGLLALKYALALLVAGTCAVVARSGGARLSVLVALGPVGIALLWIGITTVRAQVFTLFFLALLLCAFELDRRGRRSWVLGWLLVFVLWVNLHAGFVVGWIFFLAYTAEALLRGRPVRHLMLAALALPALVLVNPYGTRLYPYLWHALRLERELIDEWLPIWAAHSSIVGLFAFSLLLLLYAVARRGPLRVEGLVLLLLAAYAAIKHQRHVSIYAVTWICIIPIALEGTPLVSILTRAWTRRPRWAGVGLAALLLLCTFGIVRSRPWDLLVPANVGDHPKLVYPAGAVRYLREHRVEGNLMVPFLVGAFTLWKLHPAVKVSLDSRFEVAYPPEALATSIGFYDAQPGWRETLAADPTDMVLVPTWKPVQEEMEKLSIWREVYRDDAYRLFAQGMPELQVVDARGTRLRGEFP